MYEDLFANKDAKIGEVLRIRLPNDFSISDINRLDVLYGYKLIRPEWSVIIPDTYVPFAPAIIGVKEALIMGAAATIIKNPIVSRRFWAGWMK